MPQTQALKTPEQVREEFRNIGKPVAEWARENQIDPHRVYDVLLRRNKGQRGAAHKAAVLLGLKYGAVEAPQQ